jgi:hypothetical protein
MTARRHAKVVMLVGGDDEVARACARAVAPLPIVRAKHRDVATERLRELRPLAVYVASDVPAVDSHAIGDVAAAHETPLINLAFDAPDVVHRHLRRAPDQASSSDDTSL